MTFIPSNTEEKIEQRVQLDEMNKNLEKIVKHLEIITEDEIKDEELNDRKLI